MLGTIAASFHKNLAEELWNRAVVAASLTGSIVNAKIADSNCLKI